MTRHHLLAATLLLSSALPGCAGLFGSSRQSAPPAQGVTAEQETKLRALGGEQLVADAKMIVALPQRGSRGEYQARMCFRKYLLAHKQLREGKRTSARGNFRSCVVFCQGAEKRDFTSGDFITRTVTRCGDQQAALEGGSHLARAQRKLGAFREATGRFNWYYRSGEVKGALRQAEEKLGGENAQLQAIKSEYEKLYAERRAEIKRVGAFMNRPDIRALRQRQSRLREEIAALEKDARWSKRSQVLLRHRKSDLHAADLKFRYEVKTVGL